MSRRLAVLVFLLVACSASHADRISVSRIALEMRETTAGDRTMNVTADLTDADVDMIRADFRKRFEVDVFGIWTIPGKPNLHLVFGEPPALDPNTYGPRIYVIRHRFGRVEILHAGARLMDTEFVAPGFFGDERSVLILADHGAEDSWGLAAIHVGDAIRDLGTIDVVRPGSIDFTESALPVAHVFFEKDHYVLVFDGEVIESPGEGETKVLAKAGGQVVFVQKGNRFTASSPR